MGVALLLVSFLGGTDPASTPYLAPGFGLRGALATWLFPPMGPISFALPDPIQGQSATSLRTDDLFYPATACGALRLPSRACCKNSVVTADPLTLSLRFAAMGELKHALF